MRHFLKNRGGAAAAEMALIAPLLVGGFLVMADLGMTLFQRLDMHTAVRAGIQYAMNGGRNLSTTEEIVMQSWSGKPEDATVNASRYCLCDENAVSCTSWCSDDTAPRAYTRITAGGTLGVFVFSDPIYADEAARVR